MDHHSFNEGTVTVNREPQSSLTHIKFEGKVTLDIEQELALDIKFDLSVEDGKIYVSKNDIFPKPKNHEEAKSLIQTYYNRTKDYEPWVEEGEEGWPIENDHVFVFDFPGPKREPVGTIDIKVIS